jgi:hypothetical protein
LRDAILYGVLAAAAVLALVGGIGGFFLYRSYARRALIRLVGYREAIRAAYRALEATFASLMEESPDEMVGFAQNPDNERRRALEELCDRMSAVSVELTEIALPKSAWRAADLLVDAAKRVREEIGKIAGARSPEGVLASIASLDVEGMRTAMAEAGTELDSVLAAAKMKDPAVYGGGLYI